MVNKKPLKGGKTMHFKDGKPSLMGSRGLVLPGPPNAKMK